MSETTTYWRRCSNCKAEIAYGATYQVCSVSTCNRKRTGLVFCSTSCWDAHLPLMRHREAWAVEERAPANAAAARTAEGGSGSSTAKPATARSTSPEPPRVPRRVRVDPDRASTSSSDVPRDVLVVVSKLKKYVREKHGMNTSESVTEVLSDRMRALCDAAVRNARADGRKTLMKRDF